MREINIEHLSYLLQEAKKSNKPQPIFFLGAGASHSGNIPLASEIAEKIREEYKDSPFIRDQKDGQSSYAQLMGCLLPDQRDVLLKNYIDRANINVTHIYLAQLIHEGYVDYVLTVNFDNLLQRALALYNIFPSTYDIAILKDFTTSKFKEKSVVYLHGQHHGPWLLNTPDEMNRVRNHVLRIFDAIKDQRPWVFIGYSGTDPIFDHVKNLGRFDNGVFWVTYKDNKPCDDVHDFLSDPHRNAFVIKGYDSDSFMLTLNSLLELEQPLIVNKPFTALKKMLDQVVDINGQDHLQDVKIRLSISKRQVEEAIKQFELGEDSAPDIAENKMNVLKKEIINALLSENYDQDRIQEFERKIRENPDTEAESLLAGLYTDWGGHLGEQAKTKDGQEAEDFILQSFEKFGNAIKIKPDVYQAHYNWGCYLGLLAEKKSVTEAEDLYQQAFVKFSNAIAIKPDLHQAYCNWGIFLGRMAKMKKVKEAEDLYNQSFDKFSKSIKIKPDFYAALSGWGTYLGDLAQIKGGQLAEELYLQSIDKFRKAAELNPQGYETFINWGLSLAYLSKTKNAREAEDLLLQSFEKFGKAAEIKPDKSEAYNNWGKFLGVLAGKKVGKKAEDLYQQAFNKLSKAVELTPKQHDVYLHWGLYLGHLAQTKKDREAAVLYQQAFDKLSMSVEIEPDNSEAYYTWGSNLRHFAEKKEGPDAELLYHQALEKLNKSAELGGNCYNLACLFAILRNEEKAFYFLDLSLTRKEITPNYVEMDEDWKDFRNNENFIKVLEKARTLGTNA